MSIKSILNTNNVNITNCEHELIHLPGSIQAFGYLLAVSTQEHKILYCSANCAQLLQQPLTAVLGKPLNHFLPQEQVAAFRQFYLHKSSELVKPFVFVINGESYHTTAYEAGNVWVLEMEKLSEEQIDLPDIYLHTKRFSYHTQRADNMQTLCQDIADETRKLIGFDRVMIYRFDEDYNGQVFAESKRDDLEPFLHLHYPASDIPAQARALYLRNQIRLIANVHDEPSPLYALEADGVVPELDLSLSFLRSISPLHIQYLKNMGVGASFSISLVYQGRLWGLIACHHQSPKHIPYYMRLAAHLQGIFLSSQIDVRLVADEFELVQHTEKKLDEIRALMIKDDTNINSPKVLDLLKDLMNADGFFVWDKDAIYQTGLLPNHDQLLALREWLTQKENSSFDTAHLRKHFPPAEAMSDSVAGLVYLSMGKGSTNCAVWTRAEVEKTVAWGGDPNKAMEVKEGGTLTPRKSFQIWKQSVRYQSKAWKKAELNAASVICSSIQHQLHLSDLREEERRYRSLNERLQRANDELANMNWISTHDLKEPLRKIQLYASIVLEQQATDIPDAVKMNIGRMQKSAAKMQRLIEDLLSYAKVVNEEKQFIRIDLNAAMDEVYSELIEQIEEKSARLQWGQLPVINGIGFQIRQLFINLISNSLKFTTPDRTPVITISCNVVSRKQSFDEGAESDASYYQITVADNGIGFNAAFKADMFKIFRRFHSQQYKGSGIGLAICRKIAEAHNGFIEADSQEGEGASFSIYFPVLEQTPSLLMPKADGLGV